MADYEQESLPFYATLFETSNKRQMQILIPKKIIQNMGLKNRDQLIVSVIKTGKEVQYNKRHKEE